MQANSFHTTSKTIGEEAARLSTLDDSSAKGRLFEKLLEYAIPNVPDLEAKKCWRWKNLPQQIRDEVFSGTTRQDIGVDLAKKNQSLLANYDWRVVKTC